jgi:hypothetical protein
MSKQGNVVILGNCQVAPLRSLFNNANEGLFAESLNVNLVKNESDRKTYLQKIEAADIVLTQHLSETFHELSTPSIKSIAKMTLVIPNIFYRGWHPDMTYLGGNGKRIKGPTGDYHSLICILLSMRKTPEVNQGMEFGLLFDCLMSIKNYSELSKKALSNKFDSTDLSFEKFEERVGFEVPFMWTFNHPHNRALWELIRQSMEILDVPIDHHNSSVIDFTYSYLSKDIVWSPVISARRNISERFYSLDGIRTLKHAEFVKQSVQLMNELTVNREQIRREDLSESDLTELLKCNEFNC